jgi:DNA-binding transcriptional ArsR family regulator
MASRESVEVKHRATSSLAGRRTPLQRIWMGHARWRPCHSARCLRLRRGSHWTTANDGIPRSVSPRVTPADAARSWSDPPRSRRHAAPPGRGETASNSERRPAWQGLSIEIVRESAAGRIRALGHVDRLRIVEVLSRRPANVREIASSLGLSSTVTSRHLCELHTAQIVDRAQDGNFVVYALADRDAARLVAAAYAGAATQVRRLIALAAEAPTDGRAQTG